jgi:hypothetical protein
MANIPWERVARKHLSKIRRDFREDYGVNCSISARVYMSRCRDRVVNTGRFLAAPASLNISIKVKG